MELSFNHLHSSVSVSSTTSAPTVVRVAEGRLVLRLPISVVQEGPSVWDITPWRVGLGLPQKLRLDVSDRLLLLSWGSRRRRELSPLLLYPQVIGVAAS